MKISFLDENFSQLNQCIKSITPSKIFILVDENTHEHCLPILLGNLEINIPFEIIEIEAGEESKNIQTTVQLWEILSEFEADRKALLLNLGGGVISDLGGFLASTYKRGIKFINIPTTLLAMVDASIGGKTGIDHQFLKNMIGTFALPEGVFIYPPFLKTLAERELRSGFAEMLKHGLIAHPKHWQQLISISEFSAEEISNLIIQSAEIKSTIVSSDFKEENIRKILNFGHTIGHALESLFLKRETPILHGEAVAIGMVCETYLSYLEGFISEEIAVHIIQNIQIFFPMMSISEFSNEEILKIMLQDKKNTDGAINFSLITDIGKAQYNTPISLENIVLALEFYRNYS
ncbi:MAG: 3-dehydroquinate synthase [Flavobacteriaceae bacterium]|nr:3-dehydroquinate synthase [Flavobacteriaceae bacterium]